MTATASFYWLNIELNSEMPQAVPTTAAETGIPYRKLSLAFRQF